MTSTNILIPHEDVQMAGPLTLKSLTATLRFPVCTKLQLTCFQLPLLPKPITFLTFSTSPLKKQYKITALNTCGINYNHFQMKIMTLFTSLRLLLITEAALVITITSYLWIRASKSLFESLQVKANFQSSTSGHKVAKKPCLHFALFQLLKIPRLKDSLF